MSRTIQRRRLAPAVALTGAALLLSACGGSASGDDGDGGLSGSVRVDGSSTVAPLATVAAEMFQEQHSGVNVTVGTSGTGGGFEKFCKGETDLNDASRAIKDEESQLCATGGVEYAELQVAIDALTVVVNKENTWAKCLTVEQLGKMWAPGSTVSSWSQVDPSFPDVELKLYGPGTDSGTFDYFTKEINGEEGASRTDYSPSEDDNITIQGVEGSKGALGYFGFSYYEEAADQLTAVAVDGGSGCVAPSKQAAQDGSYTPLARPLFIYPSKQSLAENPAFEAFVDYFVANVEQVSEEALFIPLNDTQRTALDTAWSAAKS